MAVTNARAIPGGRAELDDVQAGVVANIMETFNLLHGDNGAVEVRVPQPPWQGVGGGYADSAGGRRRLADSLLRECDGQADVYVNLNTLNPALVARAANRFLRRVPRGHATSDPDVIQRRWLLIDCDADRPAGISSTDAEHQAALERAYAVRDWLVARGVPPDSIVIADSGNGAHVLVRVDLPNDAAALALVKGVLAALAVRFTDDTVKIDQTVSNAARIVKLYGTVAAKGDNTTDRPHRRSAIIEAAPTIPVTPTEVLTSIAALAPADPPRESSGQRWDLARWLEAHHVDVRGTAKAWEGGALYELTTCIGNASHDGGEAWVGQRGDGKLAAGCHHDSCSWGWRDLRRHYEPNAYTKQAGNPAGASKATSGPRDSVGAGYADPNPEPDTDTGSWTHPMLAKKDGKIQATVGNAALVLTRHPSWEGVFRYNEFSDRVVIGRTPYPMDGFTTPRAGAEVADHDVAFVSHWLARFKGMPMTVPNTATAILAAARHATFNPLTDYLDGLRWDGRERVRDWLTTYLGAEPTDEHHRMGLLWLTSAIARARKPGCKADHMLVLEGPQGAGKSSAAAILGGDFYLGHLPSLTKQDDAAMSIQGYWVVEVAELDALRGAEGTRIKTFLSLTRDRYRCPYARLHQDRPRRCVLIGTTNEMSYLHDTTGGRRFWPVRVMRLDAAALERDRDQLWAEADHLYRAGQTWWPDAEVDGGLGALQDDRHAVDPWEETIHEHLRVTTGDDVAPETIYGWLGIEKRDRDHRARQRIEGIMQRAGYRFARIRPDDAAPNAYRPRRWVKEAVTRG